MVGTVGTLADVASWWWLRRSEHLHLLPRFALDVADISVSTVDYPLPAEAQFLIGCPLAVESTARLGAVGLVVGPAEWAAVATIRRARGETTNQAGLWWLGMAGVIGLVNRFFETREHRRQSAELEQRAQARETAAHLAGQAEVAMGADSVLDLICRTEPIIAAACGAEHELDDTRKALAQWKADLGNRLSESSVMLGTACAVWQRHVRTTSLADDIYLDLEEGLGTLVMTPAQTATLSLGLGSLSMAGAVRVSLAGAAPRAPGESFALDVGDAVVVIPRDETPGLRLFDPVPVAIAIGSAWSFVSGLPRYDDCPWWAVVPGMAGSLALALWARRQSRFGPLPGHALVQACIALAGVHGALTTATARNHVDPYGSGQAFLPSLGGPTLTALLLAGHYHDDLTTSQRAVAYGTLVAAMGVAPLIRSDEIRVADAAINALFPVSAWLSGHGILRNLGTVQSMIDQAVDTALEARTTQAFRRGQRQIVAMLRNVTESLEQRLGQQPLHPKDPRLVERGVERLEAIRERLEQLEPSADDG